MPTTYKRVFNIYCFDEDYENPTKFERIEYEDLPEVIGNIYLTYDACHVSIYPEFVRNE